MFSNAYFHSGNDFSSLLDYHPIINYPIVFVKELHQRTSHYHFCEVMSIEPAQKYDKIILKERKNEMIKDVSLWIVAKCHVEILTFIVKIVC